jgi:hypothetical protein
MNKTENFFVISNYNVDPYSLAKYAKNYVIYDQSDDTRIIKLNKRRKDPRIIPYPNTGHNHIVFFKYIIDNYDNLPEMVAFLKGNIIGRHVTQTFWDKNYNNNHYTFLWDDPNFIDKEKIAYSLYSGHFIERNNSWYVTHSKHRYFTNFNQLISFFYDIDKFPEFNLFAPGGCYIVEKRRILRNPISFYEGLVRIMEYEFFPSEVWMVERMMNIVFDSDWPLKRFVYNKTELFKMISRIPDRSNWSPKNKKKNWIERVMIYRLQRILHSLEK